MKITILEHVGEYGHWEWYQIYKYSVMQPKEAVVDYLKEMNLNHKQKIEHNENIWIATEDEVRAYDYEI